MRKITALYDGGKGFIVQVPYFDYKNNLTGFQQLYGSYDKRLKTIGIKVPKEDIFKVILPNDDQFNELEDYMLSEFYSKINLKK